MKFEFIPVDYDYFDFDGRNYVQITGRNSEGKRVCVIDSYEANFWIILKKGTDSGKVAEKIEKIEIEKASRTSKVLRTEILDKKYLEKNVKAIRVFVTNHKDLHDMASAIGDMPEIEKRREYDIPIITKYIKEKKVEPLRWYTVVGNMLDINEFGGIADALDINICIFSEKIIPSKKEKKFEPKILAYDIETTSRELGKGEILMISLYGEKIKKVLTWKKCDNAQKYVEFCKDEGDMIERFVKSVRDYAPDVLTGYFSDGFDLPYLKAVAERNKVKLNLGINNRPPTFARGRIPSGKISGITHVDLFRFIKAVLSQYLQSETLSLNEVAKELIKEEKEDFDFTKLGKMETSDWRNFFSYNLQDSKVAYDLMQKLWSDILEFTYIIKEPLFDITRDTMATHVENYILHNLDRFNEIAEKRPGYDEIARRKNMKKYEGAFVFEPVPGLYENLIMFDFTSMYASVIVSYNLSKATFIKDEKFSRKLGFFPKILNEVIEKRKEYKKELVGNPSILLKARSNTYKLLANAAYGYQGFFGARYYCREAALATAKLAKENILRVIDIIEKEGYKIIYSDTDSIAFLQGKKTDDEILKFLKEINDNLPGIMELDIEDFYSRGLFVAKRGVGTGANRSAYPKLRSIGAKKKYALLGNDGKIKIRGFETVRRDWCQLSRRLQSEILTQILKDGNAKTALKTFKSVVEKLKKRKVEINDLIIRTQLRRALNEYLTDSPHVVVARKMEKAGVTISTGMLIEYYIGEGRGKKIGDRVHLPNEKTKYDVDYYLKNQVLPAVENIFDVLGVDAMAIADGESQKKLF